MSPSKVELRKFAKAKRNKLSKEDRTLFSDQIVKYLLGMLSGNVASYKAFGSEVDLAALEDEDFSISFCGVNKNEMIFYKNNSDIRFELHRFGMLNAIGGTIEDNIDYILVPLLAYDKKGYRLGYGKGYYDKYLEGKDIVKVGIAFSCQQLESLPYFEYDIRLDYVVTELGVHKF